MKKQRPYLRAMMIGMLLGFFLLADGTASAAGNGCVSAYPAQVKILVDDCPAAVEAYGINGSTFVRLVDVGKAVDFNVYWDGSVQSVRVESECPYTGQATQPAAFGIARNMTIDPDRQDIIDRTNAARRKAGRQELEVHELLMQAAQNRATELAEATLYAHIRPDGSKFSTVTDCPYVGENIHRISQPYLKYYGRELAETAVSGWLESPVHRENLLNEESAYVGVGIAKGKNDNGESAWYCVQLFMVNGGEITWVDDPIR